jgi:uncharacterized protein (TIGR02284 family)
MQTNPHRETTTNASIDKLQECLRGELSAVETYELTLKNVTHVSVHQTLQEIFVNHSRRTDQLRDKIRRLGAEPAKSSGVWGAFAKVFQAGADLLGDRTAIAALEEGEDRMLKVYTTDLEDCDAATKRFIETDLLPAQQHTHELCRSLKNYMKAAS